MGAKPEDERWAKFVTEGAPDECWEWRGALRNGYGVFSMHRPGYPTPMIASRAALLRAGIELPEGMCALHHCDNRACVNPAHLYVGDRKQNTRDCIARNRNNPPRGEKHWRATYSDAEIESWKMRHAAGESYASIARTTTASRATVNRIVRGTSRRVKEETT